MRNFSGSITQLRRSRGRRAAAALVAASALICSACSNSPAPLQKSGGNTIITMWSWLSASDAQVWGRMIADFNKANNDKGLHEQIKVTTVASDYTTKVTA